MYETLLGAQIDLTLFTPEETAIFDGAMNEYNKNPHWDTMRSHGTAVAIALYDSWGLPRREAIEKPLYRACRDMTSRLMVKQGAAKLPK